MNETTKQEFSVLYMHLIFEWLKTSM